MHNSMETVFRDYNRTKSFRFDNGDSLLTKKAIKTMLAFARREKNCIVIRLANSAAITHAFPNIKYIICKITHARNTTKIYFHIILPILPRNDDYKCHLQLYIVQWPQYPRVFVNLFVIYQWTKSINRHNIHNNNRAIHTAYMNVWRTHP